jgi:hypothetical protein
MKTRSCGEKGMKKEENSAGTTTVLDLEAIGQRPIDEVGSGNIIIKEFAYPEFWS